MHRRGPEPPLQGPPPGVHECAAPDSRVPERPGHAEDGQHGPGTAGEPPRDTRPACRVFTAIRRGRADAELSVGEVGDRARAGHGAIR